MSQMTCEDCGKKYYQPDGISDTRCSSCHAIYYATHDNPRKNLYEVYVGNVGCVYHGNSKKEAMRLYKENVEMCKTGYGRQAYEGVTLMENDEPIMEHEGTVGDNPPKKWKGKRKGVAPSSMHFHGPKGHEHRHKGKYRHNPDVRPYGPGKFDTIIDSYSWDISLDGGEDESAGDEQDVGVYYSLVRGPMLKSIQQKAKEAEDKLTPEEVAYLTKHNAGAIMSENDQGFVSVTHYSTKAELERAWKQVQAEIDRYYEDIEDEYEENPQTYSYRPFGGICRACDDLVRYCGDCRKPIIPNKRGAFKDIWCLGKGEQHLCLKCAGLRGYDVTFIAKKL